MAGNLPGLDEKVNYNLPMLEGGKKQNPNQQSWCQGQVA